MSHKKELYPLEMSAIDPRYRPYGRDTFDHAAFANRFPDLVVDIDADNNIRFLADIVTLRLLHDDPYMLHRPMPPGIERLPKLELAATAVAATAEIVPAVLETAAVAA
jgi:hypothetical protein